MAVIQLETTISATPDEAWKVLGHFEDLSWFPGVVSVDADGDTRTVTLDNGAVLTEALVSRDDTARRLVYTIVESPLGLEGHEATMVAAADGLGCRLIFSVHVEPDAAADMLDGIYRGALDGLAGKISGQ